MNYIRICTAMVILLIGINSCDRDEVFEKEQYKNIFALVSQDNNVSPKYHDLRKSESVDYISASLGGSNPSTKDIVVTLVEDQKLINDYNVSNFDVNVAKYIQPLSPSKYSIDSYQFTIPAGNIKGTLPIRVRPNGLSPDSTYFIALKVDKYSAYEANPEKDFVLYQVQIKNWWAIYGGSDYNLRGNRKEAGQTNVVEMAGTKKIYPLAENKVRLLAGGESNDKGEVRIFNKYSIEVTIGDDDKIIISPYKNIDVTQLNDDPDFPNIVKIEDDGFKTYKTFLLHYSYKGSDGKVYDMKEELRLEFREDLNDPRFLTNE